MGTRYYNPISARFTSRDPLGDDVNDYIYCGDNPVESADPSGMDWVNVAADFSAGWGDTLTFGLTGRVRMWLGANGGDAVRQNGAYLAGSGMGIANDALMGKGLADAAKKGLGKVAAKLLPKAVEAGEVGSRILRSERGAVGVVNAAREAEDLHHAFPKYLGGSLKQELRLRPVFHRKGGRLEAHILLSYMAYVLLWCIEHTHRTHGGTLTGRRVLDVLSGIELATITLRAGDGRRIALERISSPRTEEAQVLDTLGIRLPRKPRADKPPDLQLSLIDCADQFLTSKLSES